MSLLSSYLLSSPRQGSMPCVLLVRGGRRSHCRLASFNIPPSTAVEQPFSIALHWHCSAQTLRLNGAELLRAVQRAQPGRSSRVRLPGGHPCLSPSLLSLSSPLLSSPLSLFLSRVLSSSRLSPPLLLSPPLSSLLLCCTTWCAVGTVRGFGGVAFV